MTTPLSPKRVLRPKAAGTYPLEVDVVDAADVQNGATIVLKVVRR